MTTLPWRSPEERASWLREYRHRQSMSATGRIIRWRGENPIRRRLLILLLGLPLILIDQLGQLVDTVRELRSCWRR